MIMFACDPAQMCVINRAASLSPSHPQCKTFQGGATTYTAGLKFIQLPGTAQYPVISQWSWGHQGIFLVSMNAWLAPSRGVGAVTDSACLYISQAYAPWQGQLMDGQVVSI